MHFAFLFGLKKMLQFTAENPKSLTLFIAGDAGRQGKAYFVTVNPDKLIWKSPRKDLGCQASEKH